MLKKKQTGITILSLLLYWLVIGGITVAAYMGWHKYQEKLLEDEKGLVATETIKKLEQFERIVEEWVPAYTLASSTSRIALAVPVQRLQDLRAKTNNITATGCSADAKRNLLLHMDSAIELFLSFMQQQESGSDELAEKAKNHGELVRYYLNDCENKANAILNKVGT